MSGKMTFGTQLATTFASLFWLVVNLGFLATSVVLIFYPEEAATLITALDENNAADKALVQASGLIFVFATGGFNQCLSDTLTLTNITIKRFIFFLTTLYYLAASAGMLYFVSLEPSFLNNDTAIITVQTVTSLFIGALALGLLGTLVSCCSSFTILLPDMKAQAKTMTASHLPKSRAAMAGV